MLIDVNGDKKGMVTFDEAIKTAQSLSLDLVQVSPKNAEPVAKVVNFLLSDLSEVVTGEIIHADGGAHSIGGSMLPN